MSISKKVFADNFWSYLFACTILFTSGALLQRSGISTTSAHCTNAANRHFSFNRNFSHSHTLVPNQTFSLHMKKGQNARLSMDFDEPNPLMITLIITHPNNVNYQLFFNETVNLSKYDTSNSSTSIKIPCAPAGQYDILMVASENVHFKIDVSQRKSMMSQQLAHFVQTSRIRYEKRLQKRQILFKWDKSKLDIHAMHYCLAINMQQNFNTLCDIVDHIIGQSPKLFCSYLKALNYYFVRPTDTVLRIDSKRGSALVCTGHQNKQTLEGLMPNRKYFVDLFGVHENISGLNLKLGSTTIIFNRTNPIELHEDRIELGKITEFDKRSTFVFKTQRNRFKSPTKNVKFLIVPCGYAVKVKIFNQKKLKKVLNIDRTTVVTFNNTKPNERFLLKFKPSNLDDCMQNINFKVIATTKDQFLTLPSLPSNTLVEEIKSLSTCTTSTITWRPSPDRRNIKYCVAVSKIKVKNVDEKLSTTNTCDLDKSAHKIFIAGKHECIPASNHNNRMERFQISGLTPGHSYSVQLMVKLGNQRLSYRTIRIFKSQHCYVPVSMTKNQLPKVIKTHSNPYRKLITTHQYEDNNIIVP